MILSRKYPRRTPSQPPPVRDSNQGGAWGSNQEARALNFNSPARFSNRVLEGAPTRFENQRASSPPPRFQNQTVGFSNQRALTPPPTRFSNQLPQRASSPPPTRLEYQRASSPPARFTNQVSSLVPVGVSNLRASSPPTARFSNQLSQRPSSPPPARLSNQLSHPDSSGYSNQRASSPPLARLLDQTHQRASSPPQTRFPNQTLARFSNQPFQAASSPNPAPPIPPRAPNAGYLRDQYSPKPSKKIFTKPWGKSKSIDTPYLFPYTPPPPKPVTTKETASNLFTKLSNLRGKSPSPRSQDPNRKVQFLDVPPDASPLPQRRSRSPIRAVANLFKKTTLEVPRPKERRSSSLSRFFNKFHAPNSPYRELDGYVSDDATGNLSRYDDFDAGYVSDQGYSSVPRKLSTPTATGTLKRTFRKFSQGTVNFAKSLKPSNERLADNLNDYEWTKQNLLRSSELLNKSTERFAAYEQTGQRREVRVTKRNERGKVSKRKDSEG